MGETAAIRTASVRWWSFISPKTQKRVLTGPAFVVLRFELRDWRSFVQCAEWPPRVDRVRWTLAIGDWRCCPSKEQELKASQFHFRVTLKTLLRPEKQVCSHTKSLPQVLLRHLVAWLPGDFWVLFLHQGIRETECTQPLRHPSSLGLSPDPGVNRARKAMVDVISLGKWGQGAYTIGPERRLLRHRPQTPPKRRVFCSGVSCFLPCRQGNCSRPCDCNKPFIGGSVFCSSLILRVMARLMRDHPVYEMLERWRQDSFRVHGFLSQTC